MDFLQAIFLGVVQGLTEFLPVSSSGHLVIFQKLFGFTEPPIVFDALVHFGTLTALIFFFWRDIKRILKNIFQEIKAKKKGEGINLFILLVVGTIPIVIVGCLLKEGIEIIFNSLLLCGISFFITAGILFLTKAVKNPVKGIKKIKWIDALIVGLFQALAILPGVSRSGSTIGASLFQKIKKEDAFKFSFFLGMIALLGAMIINIPELSEFTGREILNGFLGFFFAGTVGFFALKILRKVVIQGKLHYFGIYCVILGIICIFFLEKV